MKLSPSDDVILDMDWMRRYKAILDVRRDIVTVTDDNETEHVCQREDREEPGPMISMVRAAKLLNDGCVDYWG